MGGKSQAKAKTVVRLGYYEDESFPQNGWNLPLAHFLESWGDARTVDGTLVPVQPLIEPLFGGMTEIEVLARIAGAGQDQPVRHRPRNLPRRLGGGDEEAWKKFLHDGFLADSAAKPVDAAFNAAAVTAALGDSRLDARAPRRPRTSSKSFSIAITRWTTAVSTTTAGCRNCPTRSPR